jgi:O-antigen ligase
MVTIFMLLAALFSIESVREMLLQRATLLQAYDTGTEGSRFNIQQRSIEMLLEHPNGMGPWVFARIYGLVSHNSYLGVFLNHGWIGGISYIALVVLTFAVGWRAIFVPTPWRDAMIATFAAYVGLALESFIVDTDHWRLYYLLIGMIWGMFAATVNYTKDRAMGYAS